MTLIMRYIKKLDGGTLKWTQPHAMIRHHELRSDGALYATLRWKKMFGSLAVGKSRESEFTFKRAGFLRPYVTVRKRGHVYNYATLRFTSGSVIVNSVVGPNGILRLASGEECLFTRLRVWKPRWAFTTILGGRLVTFDRLSKVKPSSIVSVSIEPELLHNLDLLLMLGWYVIILDYEEEEAKVGTGLVDQGG